MRASPCIIGRRSRKQDSVDKRAFRISSFLLLLFQSTVSLIRGATFIEIHRELYSSRDRDSLQNVALRGAIFYIMHDTV